MTKPKTQTKKENTDIKLDPHNYREHNEHNMGLIKKSLENYKAGRSILVDNTGTIIAGNGTFKAAQELGIKVKTIETDGTELIAVVRKDLAYDSKERAELAIMDNSTSDSSEFNIEHLKEDFPIDELLNLGLTAETLELDLDEEVGQAKEEHAKLTDKFLIPPFSVIDTRQGYWQDRKRKWNALIGDEGESREDTLGMTLLTTNMYGKTGIKNVSILDACLAEITNLWFLPNKIDYKPKTFDPFAGDTVFGFVSAYMGNSFTGIELRPEQAALNNERTKDIDANYICDDGQNVAKHLEAESQDLMFSCPPYFDLEQYSDLPNDASNQDYDGFRQIIENAFVGAIKCLKKNRFAVVVMSNVRDKKGAYHNITGDIKDVFKKEGCHLYNEIILLNVAGTAQIRAGRAMANRKVVRVHQDVLVFYKGDIKDIQKDFGEVEVADIGEGEDES